MQAAPHIPSILLVKTSSLGDVVHCLPAVSDIAKHLPHAQVDWLVEEGFAAIPHAHPFVHRVIPATFRRWRKAPFASATQQQFGAFRQAIQATHYTAVIDVQGLLKSAFLQRFASLAKDGKRHGYVAPRERLAARFYDQAHAVAWGQHAVRRNRLLVAAALGYVLNEGEIARADYGLASAIESPPPSPHPLSSHSRSALLLHGTSRANKEWPEPHWVNLVKQLAATGIACILPSGSRAEAERAQRISRAHPSARAIPPGSLAELMPLLAQATCAIGADTGLTHLAAACGVPTIGLFSTSDPDLTGVFAARARNLRHATPELVMTALADLKAL